MSSFKPASWSRFIRWKEKTVINVGIELLHKEQQFNVLCYNMCQCTIR